MLILKFLCFSHGASSCESHYYWSRQPPRFRKSYHFRRRGAGGEAGGEAYQKGQRVYVAAPIWLLRIVLCQLLTDIIHPKGYPAWEGGRRPLSQSRP